jgi:T-lymphoma invasion and metastasis-inducing protein 1
MADLQSSVVTDQDTRLQITQQIITWEENLERLHCEQFRLRCYMASLQCGELPNPKVILNLTYLTKLRVQFDFFRS